MPIAKPTTKESNVSVEIDLEKLLGQSSRNKAVQEVFFQEAFDRLLERLDQGVDVNGNKMKAYSNGYKDSLAFNAFGKSSTVNMQLTGDMIFSLGIQSTDPKKFKIGFEGGLNNTKAFAHMTGFEGHPTLDGKVKPRKFFGWTDQELKSIADSIRPQQEEKSVISDAKILALLDRLLA